MGLEVCWSYSNENHLLLNEIAGQARNDGFFWVAIGYNYTTN